MGCFEFNYSELLIFIPLMLDSSVEISFDEAPKIAQRVQEIAQILTHKGQQDFQVQLQFYKTMANNTQWKQQLETISKIVSNLLYQLSSAGELTEITNNALHTIDILYERNVDLIERCEKYSKDIKELLHINHQISENLNECRMQSQIKIEEMESEINCIEASKIEVEELYMRRAEDKIENFRKILQKQISLREKCEREIFEKQSEISKLEKINEDMLEEVVYMRHEVESRFSERQNCFEEMVKDENRVQTTKTLPISELECEYDESSGNQTSMVMNQGVSLASQLQEYIDQSTHKKTPKTSNGYNQHYPLLKQNSLGRLSTAESLTSGSLKVSQPVMLIKPQKQLKYIGLSKSNIINEKLNSQTPFQTNINRSGMFEKMNSHFQTISKSFIGFSNIFASQDSKFSKIHSFLHEKIVEKKLRKFKKKGNEKGMGKVH